MTPSSERVRPVFPCDWCKAPTSVRVNGRAYCLDCYWNLKWKNHDKAVCEAADKATRK